jgi:TRAP-type C4-dicarboxylate transport system permease small subunit
MKKLHDLLVKLSDLIFQVEKWLLVAAVVVAVAVNFINVCLRYLLNSGLSYCEMLSICLFMFMVIIGGNIAVKTNSEIRIDIFHFKDPKKNAAFQLISDVISIAAIIFSVVGLFATVQSVLANPQKVTPLPIYTYHIYIIMTIGFLMILLDHIIVLLQHILVICGTPVEKGARVL